MSKKTFKWGEFSELAKEFNIKMSAPRDKKLSPKSEKKKQDFLKCHVCGGQMTYFPETNIFLCENIVEKKKYGEDGKKIFVSEMCGNTNFVDKQYLNYINYLFKE